MKTLNLLKLALLAAAVSVTHAAYPAQLPPPPTGGRLVLSHPSAYNWGLAGASSGAIYTLGNSVQGRQFVLSTSDSGVNWFLVDDFAPEGRVVDFWFGLGGGIALDRAGTLYVTGRSYDNLYLEPAAPDHWYIRRSTDGGATWTIVDDAVMTTTSTADEMGIAVDNEGNVYVSGCDATSSSRNWIVQKGTAGVSYSIVDYLANSRPKDVFVHPTAGIFVVGSTTVTIKRQTSSAWLVRRSTDGGATWSNVDTFQLSASKPSVAWGVVSDQSDNLFVVGSANAVSKGISSDHWIVRKSTDGGNSWTTVDDYQLAIGQHSTARCVVADAHGNLLVAGRGEQGVNDGTFRNRHWVVRRSLGGTGAWTTVDVFQNAGAGTTPNAIAADPFGNVFVGGDDGSNWLVKKY